MRRFILFALIACCNSPCGAPKDTPGEVTLLKVDKKLDLPPVPQDMGKRRSQVLTRKLASEALGVKKDYVVYLPAGYDDKPDARWPVFYYLHGLGGNETNWTESGKIHEAADALKLAAIIVMPDGDDGFYINGIATIDYDKCMADGTGLFLPGRQSKKDTCVRARKYETYIVKDLIAHVDSTYRTIATKEGRAIAGLSMGGFGALQLAMRYPELFAATASHSGVDSLIYVGPHPYEKGKEQLLKDTKTWGGSFVEITRWMQGLFGPDLARWKEHDPTTLVATLEPGKLALYIDCGTEDGFFLHNGASYLHDLLLARKIDHEFYLGPGDHTFRFWQQRVPESLKFLREHTAKQ